MKTLKKFFYTNIGKHILFILTILFSSLFIACLIGIICLDEGRFYYDSEQTIYERQISGLLRGTAYRLISDSSHKEGLPDTYYYGAYYNEDIAPDIDYLIKKEDGTIVASNILDESSMNSSWDYAGIFRITSPKKDTETYGVSSEVAFIADVYPDIEPKTLSSYDGMSDQIADWIQRDYYIFYANVHPDSNAKSILYIEYRIIHLLYQLRFMIYPIAVLSLILFVILFVTLMKVSARRPDSDELHPGPLHRIPYDLLFTVTITLIIIAYAALLNEYYETSSFLIFTLILLSVITLCILLGLCMELAARIKDRSLLPNSLIGRCFKLIWKGLCLLWKGIHSIPMIWRTVIITFSLAAINGIILIIAYDTIEGAIILYLLECILVIPPILYLAIQLRRLQKAGMALAEGDLNYHTETKGMFWDFKRHGENLNDIAKGMTAAVEKQIRSERMKTELITNVSHDLKTPLTSIISYSTLISEEPCENEHIHEYSEVLVRQSERLKRLIEDLVEASKAATGNLEVLLAPCDLSILIPQVTGEYEQRLSDKHLALMVKQPEEPIHILADGRRLWRVLDNLMNNICKYAQPGTRVYLTLEQKDQSAVITFKNTSSAALDLTADELMERFVRGDSSRNTEGNGLGLSIAKSLVELQKGTFDLVIDGDLFKVILTFPITE